MTTLQTGASTCIKADCNAPLISSYDLTGKKTGAKCSNPDCTYMVTAPPSVRPIPDISKDIPSNTVKKPLRQCGYCEKKVKNKGGPALCGNHKCRTKWTEDKRTSKQGKKNKAANIMVDQQKLIKEAMDSSVTSTASNNPVALDTELIITAQGMLKEIVELREQLNEKVMMFDRLWQGYKQECNFINPVQS